MDILESPDLRNHAIVFAPAVYALGKIEAMKVANQIRDRRGEAPAYGENAFSEAVGGLHQNATIKQFYGS